MEAYLDGIWLVRLLVQRGLGAIYLIAFVSALQQFRPLLGERGLLPVPTFLERVPFRASPSIFYLHYSDAFFSALAWCGVLLALAALLGLLDAGPLWLSLAGWLALWVLYLSIVNVGQTFYGFGWESMLLEAGFFCAFLGPSTLEPSPIPVLILRFMLLRVELGAGLIKLRHDRCWRDLTCLYFHYETQPLPNPLSWYFHRLPKRLQRLSVAFSHFVQLVVPLCLLLPQPFATAAGCLIIVHQLLLVISGNYAWLNWLTIVLALSAFDDSALRYVLPIAPPSLSQPAPLYGWLMYALAAVTLALSVKPTRNLFSKQQLMNHSYNPLHLVNTYGAFGRVTRERYEVVIEGSAAPGEGGEDAGWREYELKAKPGDPRRRPPQLAPYHLRLDWLLWFLPFSVRVDAHGAVALRHELWFMRLIERLLEGEPRTLRLFRKNPFPGQPPARIRARYYRYQFTDRAERRASGAFWTRTCVGEYLPAVSAADLSALPSPLRRKR